MFERKPINQYDLDGNFIQQFPSATAAANELFTDLRLISAAATGRILTTSGYYWRYDGEPLDLEKNIIQLSADGYVSGEYSTIARACAATGLHNSGISRCLSGKQRTCGGFCWKWRWELTPDQLHCY